MINEIDDDFYMLSLVEFMVAVIICVCVRLQLLGCWVLPPALWSLWAVGLVLAHWLLCDASSLEYTSSPLTEWMVRGLEILVLSLSVEGPCSAVHSPVSTTPLLCFGTPIPSFYPCSALRDMYCTKEHYHCHGVCLVVNK